MIPAPRRPRYLVAAAVALLVCLCFVMLASVLWLSSFKQKLSLQEPVDAYFNREGERSELASRQWMNIALGLVKGGNASPAVAARLYAYTASVYADVLAATEDARQASLATKQIILLLMPVASTSLRNSMLPATADSLAREAADVLARYERRAREDGSGARWTPDMLPSRSDAWYLRSRYEFSDGSLSSDTGAMSGAWTPWLLAEVLLPPAPVIEGTLADMLDVEGVRYASAHREPTEVRTILFWDGVDNPDDRRRAVSITDAGLWQNILYVEIAEGMTDAQYAQAQKRLAQGIADASIVAWKAKYEYYRQRPSMRLIDLDTAVTDPSSPSYLSDHATIAGAAGAILSSLYPEKSAIWEALVQDAAYSRLSAGVNWKSDIEAGLRYGAMIGSGAHVPASAPSIFENVLAYTALAAANRAEDLSLDALRNWLFERSSKLSFEEVSANAGLPVPRTTSVAWGDYDGDGRPDLLIQRALYRNQGNGTFRDETAAAGLMDLPQSIAAFADMNGDGCTDIVEERTGQMFLYENDCKGSFVSTGQFISSRYGERPRGIAFADYDGDGDLDIYTTSFYLSYFDMRVSQSDTPRFGQPNVLWRNDGNGTFIDATLAAGVEGRPSCSQYPPERYTNILEKASFQPVWLDYDNDGRQDLFVATDLGISPLYRNNGDGTFTDVTQGAGLCLPGTGMGVAIADVDGNGYLDLYVTNIGANYLWMNRSGVFTEEALMRHATDFEQGWGTQLQDFDNDGDIDIYIANASLPADEFSVEEFLGESFDFRNVDTLLENDGTGHFHSVTEHAGIGDSSNKHPSAAADYDGDGRVDLYVGASGHPAGVYNSLYRNRSETGNHWITLRLRGSSANTDAVGAVVTLSAGGRQQMLEVVSGSSFFAQDSLWPHFGLGKNTKIDSLTIRWPDGQEQAISNTPIDQLVTITQPE